MKPFDPWTATIEEALQELNAGNERAVFQLQAVADIMACKPRIEEAMKIFGHEKNNTEALRKTAEAGKAIILCVKKILANGLVAPDWLSYAFNQRVYPVLHLKAAHWGQENSFGSTGADCERRRQKMLIGEYIFFNYKELKEEHDSKGNTKGYFSSFIMDKVREQPFFKEFADEKGRDARGTGQRTIEEILGRLRKSPVFKTINAKAAK